MTRLDQTTSGDLAQRRLLRAMACPARPWLLTLVLAAPCPAQCLRAEFVPSSGAPLDLFAQAVALDGRRVLGGSWLDDTVDPLDSSCNSGSATIWVEQGTGFVEEAELTLPFGRCKDRLGEEVALEGDIAVLGARTASYSGVLDSGAVCVFERSANGWGFAQMLLSPEPIEDGSFGAELALSADWLFVSATGEPVYDHTDAGAVYVYRRAASGWVLFQKLHASVPQDGDVFGAALALDGHHALIGSPKNAWAGQDSGTAYWYEFHAGAWVERAKLESPQTGWHHRYGSALALSGGLCAVGAPASDGYFDSQGQVHLVRLGPQVEELGVFRAPDPSPQMRFGSELAMDGEALVVGAPFDRSYGIAAGGAWLYKLDPGDELRFVARLRPDNLRPGDFFGLSLDVDEAQVLVGADGVDVLGLQSGAAYLFGVGPASSRGCVCSPYSPCGNFDLLHGCVNSTGRGAELMACGSASLAGDDLVLRARDLPPGQSVWVLTSPGVVPFAPFGDGLLCLGGSGGAPYRLAHASADAGGGVMFGPGLTQAFGSFTPGGSWAFQLAVRDPAGSCGTGVATTQLVGVSFTP